MGEKGENQESKLKKGGVQEEGKEKRIRQKNNGNVEIYTCSRIRENREQAGAELGQAQVKLEVIV